MNNSNKLKNKLINGKHKIGKKMKKKLSKFKTI